MKEAAKLGFTRAFAPEAVRSETSPETSVTLSTVGALADLVSRIAAKGRPRGNQTGRQDG
jgi:DNA repair protein RadA/Sms